MQASGQRHMTALHFGHDPALQTKLKVFPGVRWYDGAWEIPSELMGQVLDLARVAGKCVSAGTPPPVDLAARVISGVNEKLYPYQREDVLCALAQRHYLLNYEMGLGKTPTAIDAMKLDRAQRILVVCPALVRINWVNELDKWWPSHPAAHIVDSSAALAKLPAGDTPQIIVTSYELAGKLVDERAFDAIVVDECHYIAKSTAKRSKTVRKLLDANRQALILFLTATPITNKPDGLWHQLDSLWPGRFGHWKKFTDRYAAFIENPWSRSGFVISGLNKRTGSELRERLAFCSSRVTKQEVAHLLPPSRVLTLHVKGTKKFRPRELLADFAGMRQHLNDPDALIRACGSEKVKHVVEHAQLAIDSGERVAVLTHLRATAEEIAAALVKNGHEVCHVSGDVPIKKRMRLIEEAKASGAQLVTTMHAVNVGIDLTDWTTAIFAELDYTPATMIQAVGRFSRLSGKLPSTVYLMILEGTQDEIIAAKLLEKIADINAVVPAGHSEKFLEKAFQKACKRSGDPLVNLRKAVSTMLETDEYGV